jgi:DNA-binding transcriptional regulator YdaS (Cro superfamily)
MPRPSKPTTHESAALTDAVKRAGVGAQARIAAELDVSTGLVSQWCSGFRPVPLKYAERLAGLVSTTPEKISTAYRHAKGQYISASTNAENEWQSVYAFRQLAGLGNEQEAVECAKPRLLKFRADSLAKKRLTASSLAIMDCTGDSMYPHLNDGDVILFDTSDIKPRNDKIYVLKVPGAGADAYNVKRCKLIKGVATFVTDNPDGDHGWKPRSLDDPTFPIVVVGRVRWHAGWFM